MIGLTNIQKTGLEFAPRDKHASLLQTFVNYDRKKFYNIWSCNIIDFITCKSKTRFSAISMPMYQKIILPCV